MGGVDPVEINDVSGRLADQPGEPDLTLGLPDGLRENARRDGHSGPRFAGTSQQNGDSAFVPIDCDEPSGVERELVKFPVYEGASGS